MAVTRTKAYDGHFVVEKFTGDGTLAITLPYLVREIEYLIVGGGGGGNHKYCGGGGGAGGYLTNYPSRVGERLKIKAREISVTVGAGGNNANGSNSVITVDGVSLTAIGGGHGAPGGANVGEAAQIGGSGGGGGSTNGYTAGAAGTSGPPVQGCAGGNSAGPTGHYSSGGGGGASAAGQAATSGSGGGSGGAGENNSITGVSVGYAGGGGGSTWDSTGGSATHGGGQGGVGSTDTGATNGTDGTGGGSGGSDYPSNGKGKGGSGIVVIRYLDPAFVWIYIYGFRLYDIGAGGTTYTLDAILFSAAMAAESPSFSLRVPDIAATGAYSTAAPLSVCIRPVIEVTAAYSGKVIGNLFVDIATLKLQEITISKNVQDKLWNCTVNLDQFYNLDLTSMRNVIYATTDHLGISHALFTGIVPQTAPEIAAAANKTTLTAQDYGWYLANQMVPAAYLHNTAATNPATVIAGILGGNDWDATTGIEPYNINSVTEWGDTLDTRVFDFDDKTTKIQAIQKICDYCRYMFVVKWRLIAGTYYRPAAYFISEDDIDTDLDLPAAVTITSPDPYLKGRIGIVSKVTERYNHITVTGRNPAGTVYTKTLSSPGLTNGDELPVDFVENSGAWTTQTQVDARCLELYNFYINPSTVWTATFQDRVDLDLLQKIKFMGYTTRGVTEDWMRITSIRYTIGKAGDKTVQIEFTTDQAFSNINRMYRSNSPDSVTETEAIFDGKMAQVPTNEVGTVTSIDGNTATITLEDGRVVTARIIT